MNLKLTFKIVLVNSEPIIPITISLPLFSVYRVVDRQAIAKMWWISIGKPSIE